MPALIDDFLPEFALREVDHVAVAADPARAWDYARHIDLYRIGFARRLFALRTLPDRLDARLHGRAPPEAPSGRIDDFTGSGAGFQILGEQPGRAIAVGAIGQFWHAQIPWARVAPAGFAAFSEPEYGKVAWSIAVDPREGGGSWLTFDLRVAFTDEAAAGHFRRYWTLIGRFSRAIRRGLLRLARTELGPVDEERRAMPGDEVILRPRLQVTHSVNIEAPPDRLWPWLLQMGADRAGWYSWDRLDNGGRPSATRIIPELQQLRVGQLIPGLPGSEGGFAVLRLEPERALVLGSPSLLPGPRPESPPPEPPFQDTWSFHLEPIGDSATHLSVRVRGNYLSSVRMSALRVALPLAHEVMQRRQLHNLKWRSEQYA